jgi:hypothetical protein
MRCATFQGVAVDRALFLRQMPMAAWITQNDGYPYDMRIKMSPLHGGRGSWRTAPSIAVRSASREVVPGGLPAADVALVLRMAGGMPRRGSR